MMVEKMVKSTTTCHFVIIITVNTCIFIKSREKGLIIKEQTVSHSYVFKFSV